MRKHYLTDALFFNCITSICDKCFVKMIHKNVNTLYFTVLRIPIHNKNPMLIVRVYNMHVLF